MIAGMSQIAGIAAGGHEALGGPARLGQAHDLEGTSKVSESPFSDLLGDAVGEVSKLEGEAHQAITALMAGNGVDVHQAMIATEKASMAFELSLAVRNKAVQAYQQVISMQF